MNPILSSEADFDAYVQSRLQSSRLSRISVDKSRETQPKPQLRDSKPSFAASVRVLGQSINRQADGSLTSGISDVPFEIKHSWKAHLCSAKPTTHQLPYNQSSRPSYFVNDSVSEPRSKCNYVSENFLRPSYEDFVTPTAIDYSSTKVRTFRLQKLFKAWRLIANKSLVNIVRAQSAIIDLYQENLLIVFFDSWRNYWTAIHHHRVHLESFKFQYSLIVYNERFRNLFFVFVCHFSFDGNR